VFTAWGIMHPQAVNTV